MRGLLAIALVTAANLTIGSGVAHAESIQHYEQLRGLLFSGTPVTAIFTPSQCQNTEPSKNTRPASGMSGGVSIRAFIEIPGKHIGFADEHFTVRSDGSAVLEFIQYRVLPTDSATVTVRSLSPVTFRPLSAAHVYQCVMGEGLRFMHASSEHN